MNNAQRITKRMQQTGRQRGKDSIYAVVSDEHNVHYLTEAHLDIWWESLKPEDKAALYELHLKGALEPELPVMTTCGVSPRRMHDPAFVSAMAELVTASRIMVAAKQVRDEYLASPQRTGSGGSDHPLSSSSRPNTP